MSETRELTKLEKRYLSRRVCGWCEMPLDREACGAIWEKCSPEVRQKRRLDCLTHYKPRNPHPIEDTI